jgi:hypothetical protein
LLFHWAHLGISNCHRLLGSFEEAENALEFADNLAEPNTFISRHIDKTKSALLPEKVSNLLKNNEINSALQLLTKIIITEPDHSFALSKINSILLENKKHPGSKTTNSLLAKHYSSMKILDLVIESISDARSFSSSSETDSLTEHKA